MRVCVIAKMKKNKEVKKIFTCLVYVKNEKNGPKCKKEQCVCSIARESPELGSNK